jgi:hypothetical protein
LDVEVVLQWTYTPSGCVEQRLTVANPDFELVLDDGRATATLAAGLYDAQPGLRSVIQEELRARLAGAQLITRDPFELAGPTVTYTADDGSKRSFVEAACAHVLAMAQSVDIQQLDVNGNVIRDTKQERLDAKRELGDVSARHGSDPTLRSMLSSFDAALRDGDDELVHLYEIREALVSRFSGTQSAREVVGASKSDWSLMGRLCNDEPLRQGRHRGRMGLQLRDATDTELESARAIAVALITGYIGSLEAAGGPAA